MRQLQSQNSTSISSRPSSSPSSLVSSAAASAAPSDTLSVSDVVQVLLAVSGVCNGCLNDIILANQISDGRQLLEQEPVDRHLQTQLGPFQELQTDKELATSNCFCPITAVINVVPPSTDSIVESFQVKLVEEEVSLKVNKIKEVAAIACDAEGETNVFSSEFLFPFSALLTVADDEIQTLATILSDEYNALVL